MKTLSLIILFGIFTIYNANAHVALLNPAGGETFTAGQTITISWQEIIAHNTLNWDLYFSSDGGLTWEILQSDIDVGTLSYQWTVPAIITSTAKIRVVQDNIDSDYSDDSENFTISATTGVGTKIEANKLNIYPNPFNDYATISFDNPDNKSYTITIHDTQGRIVKTVNSIHNSTIIIERENLPNGFYFLKLFSGNELQTIGRLVIN